jgi:hypothetical protein
MSEKDAQKRAKVDLQLPVDEMGVSEIGKSMPLKRTTFWRLIQRVQAATLCWRKAQQRFLNLIVLTCDMTLLTMTEAWRAYDSPNSQIDLEPGIST